MIFATLELTTFGQNALEDTIFNENIKSLELYPQDNRLGYPVFVLDNPTVLILAFDELNENFQQYVYTFQLCNADWKPTDLLPNEYLNGFTEAYIEYYQFSKNTKVPYIHYSLTIPNQNIQFRNSGNYILKVFPENEPDKPIFTKRFYVLNPICSIFGTIVAPSNPELRKTSQEISFKVNISALNSRFPSREITTQIQQNGRYDNQINQLQALSISDNILDFNLQKNNIFQGGNTFRSFDFSSLEYNSEYIYSIDRSGEIDKIELLLAKERVLLPSKTEISMFGKFYINSTTYHDSNIEAEYAFVRFLLAREAPYLNADIYLLGGFDLWGMKHKLSYDFTNKIYSTTILLKQGVYSYQYALKEKIKDFVDITSIEGSHFQTPNNYIIRIYFRAPGTTFDQLVGWQEITNDANQFDEQNLIEQQL
jgi:hypothetical protein